MASGVENSSNGSILINSDDFGSNSWMKPYICTGCNKSHYEAGEAPFLLPCLHCLCQDCVKLGETGERKEECGNCSKPYRKDELAVHHLAAQLLGPVKPLTAEAPARHCNNCVEKKRAAAFCLECAEWVCPPCASLHSKISKFTDHECIEMANAYSCSSLSFCSKHRYEEAAYYCSTCNGETVCEKCFQEGSHQGDGHNVCRLEDALSEFGDTTDQIMKYIKLDLEEILSINKRKMRTLQSHQTVLSSRLGTVRREVAQVLIEVADAFKAAGLMMMKSVNGAVLDQEQKFKQELTNVETNQEYAEKANEFVGKYMHRASVPTKIKMQKELASIMKGNFESAKKEFPKEIATPPSMVFNIKGNIKDHVLAFVDNLVEFKLNSLGTNIQLIPHKENAKPAAGASGLTGGNPTPPKRVRTTLVNQSTTMAPTNTTTTARSGNQVAAGLHAVQLGPGAIKPTSPALLCRTIPTGASQLAQRGLMATSTGQRVAVSQVAGASTVQVAQQQHVAQSTTWHTPATERPGTGVLIQKRKRESNAGVNGKSEADDGDDVVMQTSG